MKLQNQAPHFRAYWETGSGKELLDQTGYVPSLERLEEFVPLYYQVDTLADCAVRDTYLKMPYPEASRIITPFTKGEGVADAPDSVKRMFESMQSLPQGHDAELAALGARLCRRAAINSLIVLRDYSLMGGYDYAYLNKPLIKTGALKKTAVKRLQDTLEFWVRSTREDGLALHNQAFAVQARTRLMHSYARQSILKNAPDWDTENWGQPINTWDMLATHTGFCMVFIQGLRKLGLQVSDEEEAGMYQLWKAIGKRIGIPEAVLPNNARQAVESFYLWTCLQPSADEDSRQLARALLDENLHNEVFRYQFQRRNLLYLHICMNRYLLDPEMNERLGIPKVPAAGAFPALLVRANRLRERLVSIEKQDREGHRKQMEVLQDYTAKNPVKK